MNTYEQVTVYVAFERRVTVTVHKYIFDCGHFQYCLQVGDEPCFKFMPEC
jgi:hypothetical protein